jgi:hypothetical protein
LPSLSDRPVSTKSNVGLTGLVMSLFTDIVISCSVSLPATSVAMLK